MPPRTFSNRPKPRFGSGGGRPGPGGARFDKRKEGRGGPGGSRFFQKKVCRFCQDKSDTMDYKDTEKIRKFLTEKGKIIPRRITGNCAWHQRVLARAIKQSRHAALLAFQID